ncbi:AAA family ATPase [Microcoleus sp. B4-D4]|uniref:AAA family ATPase n=1 Tax=Microcoleus sp. B4-D4 TaxID=2818667 RepID=UPI002FD206C5
MRIIRLEITNVKSFQDKVYLEFDPQFNILVGPNGGGKSNFLDILLIILKKFFLHSYSVNDGMGIGAREIRLVPSFDPAENHLDKFSADPSESKIEISFKVDAQDIKNIATINQYKTEIKSVLGNYKIQDLSPPIIDEVENWKLGELAENQELVYCIVNNLLVQPSLNSRELIYLKFLNYYELFSIVIQKAIDLQLLPPDTRLSPKYVYFSPYRGGDPLLQVTLAGESYYNLLSNSSSATSRSTTSLIKLASIYFAQKRRNYETLAKTEGYENYWDADEEVKLVTKHLNKLGYSWNLELKDANSNTYEIILIKIQENTKFYLHQASSGEKEFLNFVLGIFAYNIKNGLIIVDEPEVHLHPKWQSLLLDLFFDLADLTQNQFIFTTHSPIFINQRTISKIVRVYKSSGKSTIKKILKSNFDETKDLLHIINSHNNEKIFFADKVILVEGITDRIFWEQLINIYKKAENSEIIEVLEVHGKINLEKYRKFLKKIELDNYIIADLDYILQIGSEEVKKMFIVDYPKIDREVIKAKKSIDCQTLFEQIEEAIKSENFDQLTNLCNYIKSRKMKLDENLTDQQLQLLEIFITEKREKDKICVLSKGEVEYYLPEGYTKLNTLIELTKNKRKFRDLIIREDYREKRVELSKIICFILGINLLPDEEVVGYLSHR